MKRALVVVVIAACSSGDSATTETKSSGNAAKTGSAAGATLTAELAKDLSTSAPTAAPTPPPDKPAAGGAGSSAPSTGSGASTGSASTGSASTGSASAGSASTGSASTGAAKPIDAGVAAVATPIDAAPAKVVPPSPPPSPPPAKLTPELAAIKLSLQPNWVRDQAGAATISFVLDVPKTGDKKTFTFRYGYDLPNAPADREQYKKLLADQHVLAVTLDRQRGAAWYLEGTDSSGARAFRFIVTYGGKRLVCYGSAYHDAEHDALGDLRDEVVNQAKKICETIAL